MTEAGVVYLTAAAACVYRDACKDDDYSGASLLNEWRKMWYDVGNIQAVRTWMWKKEDRQQISYLSIYFYTQY